MSESPPLSDPAPPRADARSSAVASVDPAAAPPESGGTSANDDWGPVLARVEWRLCLRGWWRRMLVTTPWVAAVVAALVLLRLLTGLGTPGLLAIGLLLAWPWVVLGVARWREPRGFDALACWDRQAGRKETLASGYWFATRGHGGVGEQLHCLRSREQLQRAAGHLTAELPLPDRRRRVLWAPLLALGLLLPVWRHADVEAGPRLTDAMLAVAADRAERLRDQDLGFDRMEGLTPEEREALQQLEEEVRHAAELLAEGSMADARELLEELEARAETAEDLARQIGGDRGGWASEALLGEMRRHADTADLADTLHDQLAEAAAAEADRLVVALNADPLTHDVIDRLTASMRQIGDSASESDPELLAGRHLVRATDEFQQQPRPRQAAGHFEALAHDLRELALRDRAREDLEDLASQLREAGSDILGGGGEEMQRMETPGSRGEERNGIDQDSLAAMPDGVQPLGTDDLPDALNRLLEQDSEVGQASAGASPSGESRDVQLTPVPGTVTEIDGGREGDGDDADAMAMAAGEGGEGGEGAPSLMAPIPGQTPGAGDDAAPGLLAAAGAGDDSSASGQEPGTGTAPLGDAESPPDGQASGETVVRIDPATPGASTLRAVEGREREEQAGLDRRQLNIDRLRAEEQALDDLALPMARREEVRRYFHRLRESLE